MGGLRLVLMLAVLLPVEQAREVVAPAGTRLRVQFDSAVGTAISRVNDGVEVHLMKPTEVEGREVLPVGTVLTGRVLAVRNGDQRKFTIPTIRFVFTRLTLPDGRSFTVKATLTDLGVDLYVDTIGAVCRGTWAHDSREGCGSENIQPTIDLEGLNREERSAAIDSNAGGWLPGLHALHARPEEFYDITLKRGRKAWLRLDAGLGVNTEAGKDIR